MAGDFRVAVCKGHFSALRSEGRKLKIRPGEGPFSGQRRGKAHFVRGMAVFPDKERDTCISSGEWQWSPDSQLQMFNF